MTFGEKITKLRKESNYTQEQLADILKVSRQSVSKWESDMAYPETDKLISLANLFKCSTDYLLKDECTTATDNSKTESISNHQRIIGYILLAVSLIFGILTLLLAKDEESLILALIMTATLLTCSLICLFVRQKAGYWCAWTAFVPFIILSPQIVSMEFLAGIDITVICFYIIMFFVARKIFNIKLSRTRQKRRLIILGWVLFAIINLGIYIIPFFIKEGILVSPFLYIQIDLISYIIIALFMTYTVCYVKSVN